MTIVTLLRIVVISIGVAIAAGVATFAVEISLLYLEAHWEMSRTEAGGLGSVSSPLYAPSIAIGAFVLALVWLTWRRFQR